MDSNGENVQDGRRVRLVLASESPRRIEMLRTLGLQFESIPSKIDETTDLKDPVEVVEALALAKAQHIAQLLVPSAPSATDERTFVLGADTIVVLGQEILGKPTSREHAYQMLTRMSGRVHRVYTGVAIVEAGVGTMQVSHAASSVYFRSLDSAEVRCYAKTDEPMDKAGAYALQGAAGAFIDKIEGCYSNVIGLPMPLTTRMLRKIGIKVLGMT